MDELHGIALLRRRKHHRRAHRAAHAGDGPGDRGAVSGEGHVARAAAREDGVEGDGVSLLEGPLGVERCDNVVARAEVPVVGVEPGPGGAGRLEPELTQAHLGRAHEAEEEVGVLVACVESLDADLADDAAAEDRLAVVTASILPPMVCKVADA